MSQLMCDVPCVMCKVSNVVVVVVIWFAFLKLLVLVDRGSAIKGAYPV